MKISMLIGAATLALAAPAIAQDMAQPPAPTEAPPPPNDMGPQQMPQTGPMPAEPPVSDPNAGQTTGTVPANPGMIPADPNAPANPAAPVGTSANPVVMGGNATPPPAPRADYPVCSRTVQDSCINPADARKMKRKR
ncbi:Fe-S oxidoreductase [Sphingobium algorifonticola]|nr:Fe-S oxidoreductase [Sphingobium algorifonticola]